jgi:uncharacterized iron-regulated membrane protein
MTLRKTIFWTHLTAGLIAGLVIAMMSLTGVAIAFEREILGWLDRDVRRATPAAAAEALPVEALERAVAAARPGFKTTQIVIPREPDSTYEFRAGREGAVYVDQYTAEVRDPESTRTHDVLHTLEDWHRWLGLEGEGQAIGKMITGVSNAAFLLMCITGAYLWWPRKWSLRFLRPITWFLPGVQGHPRWFNWHHVFGSWSALVLILLTATAMVFSFAWAHRLVFAMAGEEPPAARGPGMLATPEAHVAAPSGAEPLAREQILAAVKNRFPEWTSIGLETKAAAGGALNLVVFEPAAFATRGRIQLAVDPYSGEVLTKTAFEDRSPGTRARVWIRFLHTGEAFGLPGRIIATIASAASLFLVYTGFMLSWRRFFGRKRAPA